MYITTTEKKIKTHLLQVDDTEIERFLKEPDSWIDVLHDLLTAKVNTNGDGDGTAHAKRAKGKKAATKRHNNTSGPGIEMVSCPKCGMRVKSRGLLIHQRGSKCRSLTGLSSLPE